MAKVRLIYIVKRSGDVVAAVDHINLDIYVGEFLSY